MLSSKFRMMVADVALLLSKKSGYKQLIIALPDRARTTLMQLLGDVETIRDLRYQQITDGLERDDFDLGSDKCVAEFCAAPKDGEEAAKAAGGPADEIAAEPAAADEAVA
eukprot:5926964-Pyramimonas_sp.AAC.1